MKVLSMYKPMFYVNGKTFNVQFLKFNALVNLIFFNNVRKYFEMERGIIISLKQNVEKFYNLKKV